MEKLDLMDRLFGVYRPIIRATKWWWWPLMINVYNVAAVAAWKFAFLCPVKMVEKCSTLILDEKLQWC